VAKITVKAGKRILVDEVRSGSVIFPKRSAKWQLRSGSAVEKLIVQVRWPSDLVEHFDNLVPVDAIQTLKEGSGVAVV